MRIGILSYHFPPEPAFIPGSLAEELAVRGHEVKVLTGFPDYPGGHVYPGWRQRWRYETHSERLTVRRVPRYSAGDGSLRGRMAGHLSFAGSAAVTGRWFLADVDALTSTCRRRTPSPRRACSACWAGCRPSCTCRTSGRRTSRSGPRTGGGPGGSPPRWRGLPGRGRIAVAAPSLRDRVVAAGVDPARVRVVLNWTDERIFHPARPSRAAHRLVRRDERCVVMHAGTIGARQGLETAVRAAAALDHTVDLVLVGSGADERRVRGLAADLRAENVRFVERRSPRDMPDLYAAADYQLVMLRDLPELRSTLPAKLQAAFSCAVPWWPPPAATPRTWWNGPGRGSPARRGTGRASPTGSGWPPPSRRPPGPTWAGAAGRRTCGRCRCRRVWSGSNGCCTRRLPGAPAPGDRRAGLAYRSTASSSGENDR